MMCGFCRRWLGADEGDGRGPAGKIRHGVFEESRGEEPLPVVGQTDHSVCVF